MKFSLPPQVGLFFIFSLFSENLPAADLGTWVKIALENNPNVLQSREALNQAVEKRRQAIGGIQPNIQAIGTFQKQDPIRNSLGQSITPTIQRNYRLNLRQSLFQGGAEWAGLSRLKNLEEAQEVTLQSTENQIISQIIDAYAAVWFKQSELEFEIKVEKIYADQVQEFRRRVNIGRSRSLDLKNAMVNQLSSLSKQARLKSEWIQLQRQLETLTNTAEPVSYSFTHLPETLTPLRLASASQYGNQALENVVSNPEYKSAVSFEEAANDEVSALFRQHLPNLGLGANYYFRRDGIASNSDWDATLTLALPIYSGGIIQSQVRESASRRAAAEQVSRKVLRDLKNRAQTYVDQLQQFEEQRKSLDQAVQLSREAFQEARQQFRLGNVTAFEWFDTVKRNIDAELELVSNRSEASRIYTQLKLVFGERPK